MEIHSEVGRHACGKCFTSFPSPDLLQSHCLTCFGEPASNTESSAASQGSPAEEDDSLIENMEVNFSQSDQMAPIDSPGSDSITVEVGSLSHPAFDPNVAKNHEPGGRCIEIIQGKKIMECTTCFKRFTNYNSFKRHRRMHVSGATHRCDICGKNFYRRYLWKNHMEKNHGCEISDAKINMRPNSKIDDDASKNISHQGHLCHVCKEVFTTRNDLSMHQSKAHSITQVAFPVYKTDEVILSENSNKQSNLINHQNVDRWENSASDGVPELMSNKFDVMSTRSSPGPLLEAKDSPPYESSLDGLTFENTNGSPAVSIGMSDSEEDEMIEDPEESTSMSGIDYGRKNENSLNSHKQYHLGSTVHKCHYCQLSFYRYDSLLAHLKKHEDGNKAFVCYKCCYEAFDADQLKVHFNSIHSTSNKRKPLILDEDREIEENIVLINSKSDNDKSHRVNQSGTTSSTNGVSIISVSSESFSCKFCRAVFEDGALFDAHMKKHFQMQCNFCGKPFVNAQKLVEHQDKDHKSKIKACYICLASFHSVQNLKTHVALHQEKALIDHLPRSMYTISNRTVSNESGQNGESLLKVKESNSNVQLGNSLNLFSSESRVEDDSSIILFKKTPVPSSNNHSAISVTLKPIESPTKSIIEIRKDSKSSKVHTCVHCGENFARQELFQRHIIRAHMVDKTAPKTISIQHKMNTTKSTSRKRIMLGPSDETYDVNNNRNVAKKSFIKLESGTEDRVSEEVGNVKERPSPLTMLTNLIDNQSTTISNKQCPILPKRSNVFRCKHCPKSFSILAHLNHHAREHFNPHFCEFCGMLFSDKMKMMTHLNTVHGKAKRYYCYACCKTVGSNMELQVHINQCPGPPVVDAIPAPSPSVQQSFGTYKECKTCHKKFVNEKRLMNHSCISGSESMWVCEICNASFPQSSHLASHQHQSHKSEEVFRCDVCGLTGNKDNIITHLATVHMTQVSGSFSHSSKTNNFENQNAMTITAVPPMNHKSYLRHQGPEVKIYSQTKRAKMNNSLLRQPEVNVMYAPRPPVHSGSRSVIDRNDNMINVPSEHDYCHMCDKMFTTAEFPEHMLREHCSGVKLVSSNVQAGIKPIQVNSSEEKNVIEIITKENSKYEKNMQLVR